MDRFGARASVCALDYGACLRERLRPGETGATALDADELALRPRELLQGFSEHPTTLERMQGNLDQFRVEDWRKVWRREAVPGFHKLAGFE